MEKRRRGGQSKWIPHSIGTLHTAPHPRATTPLPACTTRNMHSSPPTILTTPPSPAPEHPSPHRPPPLQPPPRKPNHSKSSSQPANTATHNPSSTAQIQRKTPRKTKEKPRTHQQALQPHHRARNPLPQRPKHRLRLLDRSFLPTPADESARTPKTTNQTTTKKTPPNQPLAPT